MRYSLPALFLLALFTACGPGSNPNLKSADDPSGDAKGKTGTNWDLIHVEAERQGNVLVLRLGFTQEVKLPEFNATADANQLTAYLALDTDRKTLTDDTQLRGILTLGSTCTSFSKSNLGVEYLVELFERNAKGNYTILGPGATPAGEATPRAEGQTLTLSLPLSVLGNPQGSANLGMDVGNGKENTDCFPDQGVFALP